MAEFIECVLSARGYRGSTITNSAVNLSLCTSIAKTRIRWYPDNDGIPAIKFHGCDVEWAFNSDEQRDAEYRRIVAATPQSAEGGNDG